MSARELRPGDPVWVLGEVKYAGKDKVKVAFRGLNAVMAIVRPAACRAATWEPVDPTGPVDLPPEDPPTARPAA